MSVRENVRYTISSSFSTDKENASAATHQVTAQLKMNEMVSLSEENKIIKPHHNRLKTLKTNRKNNNTIAGNNCSAV